MRNRFRIAGLDGELLLYNDGVTLVHDATKICWDKSPANTYAEKKDFIRKRMATGHESILEHSNIVMMLTFDQYYMDDFLQLNFYYLHTVFESRMMGNKPYRVLIGGSIRGYKHLFRTCYDRNNQILNKIASILQMITPREFWIDLIEDYSIKDSFVTIMTTREWEDGQEIDETKENFSELHPVNSTNTDLIEIVNMDDSIQLENKLEDTGFIIEDLLDMCTVTIKFKHMSRIITQQLVRHRNGITQASGRYIDLSDKVEFNSPEKFKDKYVGKTYNITIGGKDFNGLTLQEIGDMLTPIYKQIKDQGVDKEDARGFLLQNCQCGDLYMTFTYRTLIKFLQLRTHTSAQAEIRRYAQIIYDSLNNILQDKLNVNDIYSYLQPVYIPRDIRNDPGEYSEVDEAIGIEESISEEENTNE